MNVVATYPIASKLQEIRESAVLDVADFIRREGRLLVDLLDFLDDMDGVDAVVNLIALCESPLPDHVAVAGELAELKVALECVSLLHLDDLIRAGAAPFDLPGLVRWAGARVSECHQRMARMR